MPRVDLHVTDLGEINEKLWPFLSDLLHDGCPDATIETMLTDQGMLIVRCHWWRTDSISRAQLIWRAYKEGYEVCLELNGGKRWAM
jgi:hypothetical protein